MFPRAAPRLLTRLPRPLLPSARRATSRFSPPPGTPSAPYTTAPTYQFGRVPASSLFSLQDKVCVVTGGARGLGFQQASALVESGATVYAFDLPETPSTAFSNFALHNPLHYRRVDVTDPTALARAVTAITDTHGRLDGAIAAAGIQQETPALEYTPEDFTRMLHVNVLGVFLTFQACAREIIRTRTPAASLVAVASMSARIANRGLSCAPYNASKAAVAQMVRGLAAEWGGMGIRVNSVSPGYCRTEMVEGLFQRVPQRREAWAAENMLGRVSEPAEYRGVAVWLMSAEASGFVTGSDVVVDGGHTAW